MLAIYLLVVERRERETGRKGEKKGRDARKTRKQKEGYFEKEL